MKRNKKNKTLTKHEEATAVIIGSMLMYATDFLIDKSKRNSLTAIRLRQALNTKLKNKKYNEYVTLSNKAWSKTIDQFKDDDIQITVPQFVENLAFDKFDLMKEFYGNNIIDLADRFSIKHTMLNTPKKYVQDTRKVTDALKKHISKELYEYFKE